MRRRNWTYRAGHGRQRKKAGKGGFRIQDWEPARQLIERLIGDTAMPSATETYQDELRQMSEGQLLRECRRVYFVWRKTSGSTRDTFAAMCQECEQVCQERGLEAIWYEACAQERLMGGEA